MSEASGILLKQGTLTIKILVSRSQMMRILWLAKISSKGCRDTTLSFGPGNCQHEIVGKKYLSEIYLVNIDHV